MTADERDLLRQTSLNVEALASAVVAHAQTVADILAIVIDQKTELSELRQRVETLERRDTRPFYTTLN